MLAGHPDHIRDGRVIYYQTWQRIPSQTGTSEHRVFLKARVFIFFLILKNDGNGVVSGVAVSIIFNTVYINKKIYCHNLSARGGRAEKGIYFRYNNGIKKYTICYILMHFIGTTRIRPDKVK